ncbi:NUDIX hydrolase [Microbacterium sp. USHLN186]|uniref:NUDIX hydrolase n=1 Tax=Microbacterium sp. USHLN186 TaxID=3081286 RepID=UPI00301B53E5
MQLRVAAYGIITDDEGNVLLARWVEGRRVAWTLPGGGLEAGEDPERAVRRELREETGFEIETTELLGIHSRVIPASQRVRRDESDVPLHTLRIVYRARITGGALRFEKNGSTDMAGWFTLDEVAALQRVRLVDIGLRMAELLPTSAGS